MEAQIHQKSFLIGDASYAKDAGSVTQSFKAAMKKKPSMENNIPTREISFEVVYRATADGRGKWVVTFPADTPRGTYINPKELEQQVAEMVRLHSEKKRKQNVLNRTRVSRV